MPSPLPLVEAFLSQFPEVKPSWIGAKAIGDHNLVRQLRKGRRVRVDTAEKIARWIRNEKRRLTRPKRAARGTTSPGEVS